MNKTQRNRIATAVREARRKLSPAQCALRGQRRRYHIWSDASALLTRWGYFMEAMIATERSVAGWHRVPAHTALELSKD